MAAEEEISLESEFATSTTLHGLKYIATSKRFFFKLLWVLIFISGLSLCVWQISLRIQEYLLFNINTEINLMFVDELEFPALTICNFNRYRASYLTANDLNLIKFLWDAEDYDYYESGNNIQYNDAFINGNFSTSEFTNRTGFQLTNQTIQSCKWKEKKCGGQNFTHLFTSFGNCFTFNSGKYNDVLKVRQPGAGNALQLMINIQQDEYTETSEGNMEAGLKILVHPQNEPPLIESKGLAVPPGVHAYVSTRKIEVETLGKPHGDCDKSVKLNNYEIYTVAGCLLECRHKHIVEECDCRPIRQSVMEDSLEIHSKTYDELKTATDILLKNFKQMETDLKSKQDKMVNIEAEMLRMERHSRSYNLRFGGIEERESEDPKQLVLDILKHDLN
ncbi:acid-sensing ion channel 5-like [Anneissia japonica]|uniref:acid-sensing ion channel 5-like n=1 Tax=Anneissia japonica TaxID=1529436 RepID=UPI001425981C|nr:acid-sensing ion channel 5-like [Anneissia japonica]